MRRGWIVVALLLSLGVNLGLVGMAVARRRAFEHRWAAGAFDSRGSAPSADRAGERGAPGPDGRKSELSETEIGKLLAERIGLEGERRERFVAAHRKMAEEVGDARRDVRRVRDEMRREVAAPEPDRTRLDELLGDLATAESRVNRSFLDGILDVRSGLDPEESRKLLGLIADLGLVRPSGLARGAGAAGGGSPFGRRTGGDRRPPAAEPAPAAPAAKP